RSVRLSFGFALVLAVAAPGVVSADPAVRFNEHGVAIFCDAAGPEGELHLFGVTSSEFGDFAELFASAAPVDPEAPPDVSGTTDAVTVVEAGGGATFTITIPLGMDVGNAIVDAVLTPTGEVITLEPFRDGNRWVKTTGTIAVMEVTGTLDLPGDLPDFSLSDLGCGGEIFDVEVFETQPHAFVIENEGVIVDCTWASDGTFAHLFAVNDSFGTFAEASLFTEGVVDLFGSTEEVTLDGTSLEVDIPLFNFITEEPESASASSTLTASGDPVTSIVISQNSREKVTQQLLIPDGTLNFSTGDAFVMDAENCVAFEIESHAVFTGPAGPKPGGGAPVNDMPDGAIPLDIGDSLNAQTRGAALQPEPQVTTCPAPDDGVGQTVWYSFTGTGGAVTIDTAGSNFDTVIAVYDDELVELACNDDVEFGPIGFTFQAALTIDTVEDATYYVQAGGYMNPFEGVGAQFGRLRISLE
ncbi:MAG TPA: hypothetical protein VFP27_14655, partial [Mycobacterium sp.]|nr:hypothetical protein [Mycobacterium sp.]